MSFSRKQKHTRLVKSALYKFEMAAQAIRSMSAEELMDLAKIIPEADWKVIGWVERERKLIDF